MPALSPLAEACRAHGAHFTVRRLRAAWLLAQCLRLADALVRAWNARRITRELESWPEERLKDVGLNRGEVASAVDGLRRPFRWEPECDASKMDPARFGH